MNRKVFSVALIAAGLVFFAGVAQAKNLEAAPGAPAWAHFGAAALLYLHIGGGTLGMLSGVASLSTRKGARLHRMAGAVFFVSMFITYLIGAGVAPFLDEGQRPNFIAGVMALYLLISGLLAVRRRDKSAGALEIAGLVIAVAIAIAGVVFMRMGAESPTGTVDGSPPQAFILFAFAGTAAALGEINVLLRRGVVGVARVARHLWRMCFSLFIASGSFFLGQMQFQPEWFRESAAPYVLALAPLPVMVFWLVWVRFAGRFRRPARAAPT
jgi:hypothetical protein